MKKTIIVFILICVVFMTMSCSSPVKMYQVGQTDGVLKADLPIYPNKEIPDMSLFNNTQVCELFGKEFCLQLNSVLSYGIRGGELARYDYCEDGLPLSLYYDIYTGNLSIIEMGDIEYCLQEGIVETADSLLQLCQNLLVEIFEIDIAKYNIDIYTQIRKEQVNEQTNKTVEAIYETVDGFYLPENLNRFVTSRYNQITLANYIVEYQYCVNGIKTNDHITIAVAADNNRFTLRYAVFKDINQYNKLDLKNLDIDYYDSLAENELINISKNNQIKIVESNTDRRIVYIDGKYYLHYQNNIKYQSLIKDLSSGEIVEFLIALNM